MCDCVWCNIDDVYNKTRGNDCKPWAVGCRFETLLSLYVTISHEKFILVIVIIVLLFPTLIYHGFYTLSIYHNIYWSLCYRAPRLSNICKEKKNKKVNRITIYINMGSVVVVGLFKASCGIEYQTLLFPSDMSPCISSR